VRDCCRSCSSSLGQLSGYISLSQTENSAYATGQTAQKTIAASKATILFIVILLYRMMRLVERLHSIGIEPTSHLDRS